jgi:hypothetical protein
LTKDVIHDLYKKLLKSGGRGGKPLAPTTVRTLHRILMKAFKDLGIEITGVRQPRVPKNLRRGRKGVWSAEEASAFLADHPSMAHLSRRGGSTLIIEQTPVKRGPRSSPPWQYRDRLQPRQRRCQHHL